MAYIGRPLQVSNLAVMSAVGDGSDVTPIATLDYATTTNGIAVYLDGVRQLAGTDFNVTSQTTLTFTTAPANGVGIDVYFLGLELSLPTPADATVAKAKITTTLINEHVDTVITAADSILFSDATDSNANKKDTVQGILDLVPAAGADTSLSNLSAAGGQQVVKMWINFNGTGTVAIRDSYNVTSITDNGTGDYSVTIDTDFANINYSITAPSAWIATGGPEHHVVLNRVNTSGAEYAPTVTAFRMTTSMAGTMTDAKYVYASACGD